MNEVMKEEWMKLWASVAKWLAHLPFTSEAAGSSLSENFLNATRTQSSCEKSKSQRSAESRGFQWRNYYGLRPGEPGGHQPQWAKWGPPGLGDRQKHWPRPLICYNVVF